MLIHLISFLKIPGSGVTVYNSKYNLPGDSLYFYNNPKIDFIYYLNKKLFVSDNSGLKLLKLMKINYSFLIKRKKFQKHIVGRRVITNYLLLT